MTDCDPAWLDQMYNNRALVPDHAVHLREWSEGSAAARAELPVKLGLPYGPGQRETLDLFVPDAGAAPVLVFIHGGYWRSLHSSDYAFVAPPFVRAGACVVLPNYELCPAVSVPEVTLQMVKALAWVHRNIARHGGDPTRVTVAGHSAGGHLAAMMLACDWTKVNPRLPATVVRNGMSISGLHELETLRHTPYLQVSLKLTPKQALQASPAWMKPPPRRDGGGELYAVVGGLESAEFLRQNQLIADAWGKQRVPVCEVLPGLNHFSIAQALARPGHRLHQLARHLLGLPV